MAKPPFLTSLNLKNYRNINSEVSFPNPAIIIGPNGSGKSNLFESIQFLQYVVTEPLPGSILKAIKNLGGLSIVFSKYAKENNIKFKYDFFMDHGDLDLNATLDFALSVSENTQEVSVSNESLLFASHDTGREREIYSYSQNRRHGIDTSLIQIHKILDEARLSKTDLILKQIKDNDTDIQSFCRKLQDHMLNWRFYNGNNFVLKSIRSMPPMIDSNEVLVNGDGTNLSNAFFNIINSSRHHEAVDIIFNFIKDNLDANFSYIKTPVFDNRFISLVYQRSNGKFNLETLPDGLIRMLILTAILLHPTPPSLIVIDEPELGLHPQWMKPLMELIWRAAEKTQVIIATHSPDLLDYLDTEEAGHVIVAEQDEQGLAQFNTLDPEALSEWLHDYSIGELYRLGRPEVGGWT